MKSRNHGSGQLERIARSDTATRARVGLHGLVDFIRTMTFIALDLNVIVPAGNEEGLFAFHNYHRFRIRGMGTAKRCKKKTDKEGQTEKAVHFHRLQINGEEAPYEIFKRKITNSLRFEFPP